MRGSATIVWSGCAAMFLLLLPMLLLMGGGWADLGLLAALLAYCGVVGTGLFFALDRWA